MSREKDDKQLHAYQFKTLRVEEEWMELVWKNVVRKIIAIRRKEKCGGNEKAFLGTVNRVIWSLGPIALDTENRGSNWEIFADLTMSCDLDAQEQKKVVRLHPPLT